MRSRGIWGPSGFRPKTGQYHRIESRANLLMKIEDSKIGFIGLGGMGERLARRLLERGFRLTIYDRTAQRMDPLVAIGATAADSLRMLGANSDVIISCVTNDRAGFDI